MTNNLRGISCIQATFKRSAVTSNARLTR
jgi:hypothetical protein